MATFVDRARNMETTRGEVERTVQLGMVGGDGEYSYAANSLSQRKLIIMTKSMLETAIEQMYKTLMPLERITIVDLGCSSGPNTFLVFSEVLDTISKLHKQSEEELETLPQIQFVVNDLPSNDFNSVFRSWEEFKKKFKEERGNLVIPYYVSAVSGSFHGRLFPSSTIHFFHSSNSLHWLSQVPEELERTQAVSQNKKYIHITRTSPPWMVKAYQKQFRRDFSIFLKSRFEELSVGGGALLTFCGRDDVNVDTSNLLELLADSLSAMAEEGIISKDKLNAFYIPFYAPLLEEVKSIILSESSFHIEHAHFLSYKPFEYHDKIQVDIVREGKKIANTWRAVIQSLVAHHFGDDILDELFERFAKRMSKSILEEKLIDYCSSSVVVVLKKNTL